MKSIEDVVAAQDLTQGGEMAKFPETEWISALAEKLNSDEEYARIARNWEGDMFVKVLPGGALKNERRFYLDLWHGKCRNAYEVEPGQTPKAVLQLSLPYENAVRLLKGELDAMQALLTRKISVQGNMAILMRNVPTVLDFVRCCREVTDSYV
jgi:putative sterol carrier protein